MNEIERLLEDGFDVNVLMKCAHEVGHGHYYVRHSIKVAYMTPRETMPRRQRISEGQRKHYLIGTAAGAASQCRFLERYAGWPKAKAKSYACSSKFSGVDKSLFKAECKELDLRMSFDSAFSTAYDWVCSNGGKLDRRTAKLAKRGRLSGSGVA